MKNYLNTLKQDKKEIIKLSIIALFAYMLVKLLFSQFSTSAGYDMRGEFLGYLFQLSFLLFLYIDHKARNIEELRCFKCLAFIQLSLSIFCFLILKTFWFGYLIKFLAIFLAIFLFLFLIKIIKYYDK